MTTRTFVIVGASLAGAKAAETLRAEGFAGRMRARRRGARPPVRASAAVQGLSARRDRPRQRPTSTTKGFYADHDIELRSSTTATALDAERHTAAAAPRRHRRDARATTGCCSPPAPRPRRLACPGRSSPGVHYLRSLGDCRPRSRAALGAADTVVVVGAGWIGSEVAASARQLGREVTMVAPNTVPLERVLGPEVGGVYRDLHREHGVRFRLGTGIEAIRGDGHGRGDRSRPTAAGSRRTSS